MERYPFVIDTTPYCIWDLDMNQVALDFLNMIDAGYFDHVAAVNEELLKSEQARYAALTLRTTYSHALETLFALICAGLQAPQAVSAWMLKYQNEELNNVVRKIQAGDSILNRHIVPITWEGIVDIYIPSLEGGAEKTTRLKAQLVRFWRSLAHDFLAQEMKDEYNSFKHGLRVDAQSFILMMGIENTPGERAPVENMHVLGTSEYGSGYYTAEKIDVKDKANIRFVRHVHNWNPEKFVHALQLISMSIENTIATMKVWHGIDPSTLKYRFPFDEGSFELPWIQERPRITTFHTQDVFEEDEISSMTKDEILSTYTNANTNGHSNLDSPHSSAC